MEIRQTTLRHITHGCGRRGWLTLDWENEDEATFVEAREIGSLVHAGLAAYYQGFDMGGEIEAVTHDLPAPEGWDDYILQALNLCNEYVTHVEAEGWDVGLDILAVEQKEYHPIGEHTLSFIPDLIVRDSAGMLRVIDFKTRKKFQTLHHQDYQGRTYCAYTEHREDDEPVLFEWRQIKQYKQKGRTKPPYFKHDEVWYGTEELAAHKVQVEEGLVARNTLPRFNGECEWSCPYYDVCVLMDQGYDVQEIMQDRGMKPREEEQ